MLNYRGPTLNSQVTVSLSRGLHVADRRGPAALALRGANRLAALAGPVGAGRRLGAVASEEEIAMTEGRPPFPPFDVDGAIAKVQAAEDAWNTRDPRRVSLAYTEDSVWRNRDVFLTGRAEIVEFLTAKWERELDYVLRKSLWGFRENRIAVRFQYEWHDEGGQWFRSYGNELWEFDERGLMRRREASINDVTIDESDRRYFGPRPDSERGPGHDIALE
jgi:nuclear transport factor 2 (NTF2) superfamily protein